VEERLPSHARVVVVGGGIAGTSVAYHLAKAGWTDVVVFEQNAAGGGTTWHAAGMVARIRAAPILSSITIASARLYASLEAETGVSPDWVGCGSLLLARTTDRLISLRRLAATARTVGIESAEVSPDEAGRLWPGIRTDDLAGAWWVPGDGKVNPGQTAAALAEGARRAGARVLEGVRVERLVQSGGLVTGVETAEGSISAEWVVLAAGMWSRHLAAEVGVSVPLHPVEHHYVDYGPVDGASDDLPCMRDYDGATYFRPDGDGVWLGAFGERSVPWTSDRPPAGFWFRLLDPDWETFAPALTEGRRRLPALDMAPVRRFVNGPESFTPDGQYLLGPAAEVEGLFLLCGFNSFGIAQSGGAGDMAARWLVEGSPPADLWIVDPSRFGPWQSSPGYLRERVPEMLANAYAMAWPNREPVSARGVRRSPLHDRLDAEGAAFGARAGWERPLSFAREGRLPLLAYSWDRTASFADWEREHRAARESVALFDQTSFAKYMVTGADTAAVLGRLCSADVDVPGGTVVYTAMLDERGRFMSDLTVTRLREDAYYVVTAAAQQWHDAAWIRRGIGDARAELRDVTSAFAVIGLHGPLAREVLAPLVEGDLSPAAFPFLAARWITVGAAQALAMRVSYVGELGFELHGSSEHAAAVFDLLRPAVEAAGGVLAGFTAMNSLRLEKAFGAWGLDLSTEDTPLEAGMGFIVDPEKPIDFLGRDVCLRQLEEGVRRRLLTFVLDDPDPLLWGGEPILRDGAAAGYLTSGSYGHTVAAGVGMGYVRTPDASLIDERTIADGPYEIEIAGRRVPARTFPRAPYDPGHGRMRR
jgi:4-methylaminobutanoate oxidase (formaldehyde-forming)